MIRWLIAAVAALHLCAPVSAQPRPRCGAFVEVKSVLENKHKERVLFAAKIRGPAGLVLYRSPKGNWTLLTIGRSGLACLVAHGKTSTLNLSPSKPPHSDSPP